MNDIYECIELRQKVRRLQNKIKNQKKQVALEELSWVIDHLHCQEDIEEIEKRITELKEANKK